MSRWQLYALLGTAFALGALAIRFMPEVPTAVAQDDEAVDAVDAVDAGDAGDAGDPVDAGDAGDAVDAVADTEAPAEEEAVPAIVPSEGGRLVCRLFLVDVGDGDVLDTSDRTTEVGQWVGQRLDQGMSLHGVDFEVGQKTTGYPQGYLHVCVYPG
jgi:hypothetical protein